MLRWFVDENMLAVGKALSHVRPDLVYPGHEVLPEVPRGTKDEDWLPIVGADGMDLLVITRDNRIRRKLLELEAFKANGVRAFFLTGKKELDRWQKFELLVKSWDRMEKQAAKYPAGPWAKGITQGRLVDIPI